MGNPVDIDALDGEGRFTAYRSLPGGVPRGTVIVVQEIFGVNAGIRHVADRWARAGFLALAPDMFWRFAPGYVADADVPAQLADASEVRHGLDQDAAVRDIEATIRFARREIGGGKVGVVGYCMGARIAFYVAARTDVDATVGYYGARIDEGLAESRGIARPLLLHFAGQDALIPADARMRIHAALDGNPQATIHDYPDADHGFAVAFGKRRDEAAADLADERTRAFLEEHLA